MANISTLRAIKPDWFMLGMIAAVALAWIFPAPGTEGGWMHPDILTKCGIALVFFLHGLVLSFDKMKAGALRWKIHVVVQCCTFLFFPMIGLLVFFLCKNLLPADLRMGFFFLCALPSTVSSSVAMTAVAHGNVAAAVFNATLSSLLGIFLTPIWISIVAQHDANAMPLGHIILDLIIWLLTPLVLGQLLRPWLSAFAERHKSIISKVDRCTVLLLVYTSFCDSVKWNVWTSHGSAIVIESFAGAAILFSIVLGITNLACRVLGFTLPDKSATVFCGSKKSLAQGVPMARLIFASNPSIGVILLPIMIYHPLQIFICGMLATRWAKLPIAKIGSQER